MDRRTPLSPVDFCFTGHDAYAVEFGLYFPYALDADRLRAALDRTVASFWPVAATLETDREAGYCLVPRPEPLDFRELPATDGVPDWRNPQSLVPFATTIVSAPGEALARFRLARCGAGSFFVANVSHCVVDGYSFFFFLSALAAQYRSSRFSLERAKLALLKPDCDRTKLRASAVDIDRSPHRTAVDADDVLARTGIAYAEPRVLPKPGSSQWEFYRFADEELSAWLKAAETETTIRISRHDVLAATLWKRIGESWHRSGEQLSLSSAFDYRRVAKALSPTYFGNAIRAAAAFFDRDELLQAPLGKVAERIRRATAAIDEAAVQASLACMTELRRLHGTAVPVRLHVSHPRTGFLVTNLSRVPRQELDFGQGPPEMLVPLTAAPRSAVVLPGTDGVEVRLELPATAEGR